MRKSGSILYEADVLAKHMTNRYAIKEALEQPYVDQSIEQFTGWKSLTEELDSMVAERE